MAVDQADADVVDAVAAREDPAVARADGAVPDHLELVDARAHCVVLQVAAQRHAARRVAVRHAGGQQRLRHRAAGEHEPAAAQLARDLAPLQPRADHGAALLERRDEAQRRKHPRARRHRRAAQDVIELPARQHRQRARHVDTPAARADAAHMRGRLRLRQHGIEHPELAQRMVRIGDQAVAADLVAREGMLVDQHGIEAGACQRGRGGAAGRAGADDEHVALQGKMFEAEVHGAGGDAARGF